MWLWDFVALSLCGSMSCGILSCGILSVGIMSCGILSSGILTWIRFATQNNTPCELPRGPTATDLLSGVELYPGLFNISIIINVMITTYTVLGSFRKIALLPASIWAHRCYVSVIKHSFSKPSSGLSCHYGAKPGGCRVSVLVLRIKTMKYLEGTLDTYRHLGEYTR